MFATVRRATRMLALFALVSPVLLVSSASAAGPASGVVFDSIPATLPGNVASVGFEATSTSEFGDYATFASNPNHVLANVDVVMSSWGCQTGTWTSGCATTSGQTFSHPITFTVYANDSGSPGAVLASATQTFAIPFRPSADPVNCPATPTKWYSTADHSCYNGFATPITFDFSSQHVSLPAKVIYGISYNTTHYGATPIGETASCYTSSGGCGYDSLNVGAESTTPTVGTDDDPNGVFLNSSSAGSYCDGGTTGTFRLDTSSTSPCVYPSNAWTGYNPLVRFNATLAGSTCVVADSGTTRTLLADCTTSQTLTIPPGFTFDGADHTITAVDPSGGHFLGAILQNAGTTASVHNLKLTALNLTDACDAGADRLRGILFDGATGAIDMVFPHTQE